MRLSLGVMVTAFLLSPAAQAADIFSEPRDLVAAIYDDYNLGRTVADRYLFFCFGTDGKVTRVIAARDMTEGEQKFYDRKYAEFR